MAAIDKESQKYYIKGKDLVETDLFKEWVNKLNRNVKRDKQKILTEIGTGERSAKMVVGRLVALFRNSHNREKKTLERINQRLILKNRRSLHITYDIAVYFDEDKKGTLEKLSRDLNGMGFNIAQNHAIDLLDGRKVILLKVNVVREDILGGVLNEIQKLQIMGIAEQVGDDIRPLTDRQMRKIKRIEKSLAKTLKD